MFFVFLFFFSSFEGRDLLGHIGRVTSGLMIGIFLFLVAAAAAAELMASLSLPQWPSTEANSSGLGGRSDKMEILCDGVVAGPPVDDPDEEPAAAAAATLASKVDPLEILRVAVGEGWSDDVGVGSRRADEAGDTEPDERCRCPAPDAGRDGSCSCTGVGVSLLGVGERVTGVGRVVRNVVLV